MRKANLIKALSTINKKLIDNSFEILTPRGLKKIDVRFQDDEVLFFSYNNYDSPIIFNTLNKALKHFSS